MLHPRAKSNLHFAGLAFRDLAFSAPPLIQCWGVRSAGSGVEEVILTVFAFNIVSGGVGGHSTAQTKKTDESASYILHVGVRFLGMVGHQVEQHVSLAVLAQAFALALTSHQNRFLQTFGAKPTSGVGWEWQVFRRRVVR